jgi:hypothetical protein
MVARVGNAGRRDNGTVFVQERNAFGGHDQCPVVFVKTFASRARFASLKPAAPAGWVIRWWLGNFRDGFGIMSNPTLRISASVVDPTVRAA